MRKEVESQTPKSSRKTLPSGRSEQVRLKAVLCPARLLVIKELPEEKGAMEVEENSGINELEELNMGNLRKTCALIFASAKSLHVSSVQLLNLLAILRETLWHVRHYKNGGYDFFHVLKSKVRLGLKSNAPERSDMQPGLHTNMMLDGSSPSASAHFNPVRNCHRFTLHGLPRRRFLDPHHVSIRDKN